MKPPTETLVEQVPEVPFYIPATGPATRPRRSLKHGDCFAVLDSHGDIGATPGGPDGLYHCDTRHLGHLELLLNGMQLLVLGSNTRDDNSLLTVDLTNADMYSNEKLVLPKDTLHLVRTVFLWRATAYQRLRIQNHGDREVRCTLSLAFASDFADLFEVRGLRRPRRGTLRAERTGPDQVALNYAGLDGKALRTLLSFEPVPARISTNAASYELVLEPGESQRICATAQCSSEDAPADRPFVFHKGMRAAFKENRTASRNITAIVTSNEIFNEVLCRSMADLSMLTTTTRRTLSLCGHPVVLDHVRPRRDHHRDRDAVVRSGTGQGRTAPARRPPSQGFRRACRRRTRERFCTRCAAARWRRCAKFRSVSITAAWTLRRCS